MNRADYIDMIVVGLQKNNIDYNILLKHIIDENFINIENFFVIYCPLVYKYFVENKITNYEKLEILKDSIIEYAASEYK